jgi:hypothetical protein
MFIDHFAAVFLPHANILGLTLKLFGRTVAPIMCFLITEGYHYTSNRKKYIARLLAFAVISHLPYNIAFGYTFFQATSVIWPLSMGLIALMAFKSDKLHFFLKLIILTVCCALSIRANWNFVAVCWIVVFGLYRGNFKKQIAAFCVVGVMLHLVPTFYRFGFFHDAFPQWHQLGIFLAIPLLLMYNGKLGKKSKVMAWAFYVFYPAHLIFLHLLNKYTSLSEVLVRLF